MNDFDNALAKGNFVIREERRGVPKIEAKRESDTPMSQKYPKYYKKIPEGWTEIDVYGVCLLFPNSDASGCIHHAIKKLLVPGARTGGKSFREDIKEARDTLTRYLELIPKA